MQKLLNMKLVLKIICSLNWFQHFYFYSCNIIIILTNFSIKMNNFWIICYVFYLIINRFLEGQNHKVKLLQKVHYLFELNFNYHTILSIWRSILSLKYIFIFEIMYKCMDVCFNVESQISPWVIQNHHLKLCDVIALSYQQHFWLVSNSETHLKLDENSPWYYSINPCMCGFS